MRSLGCLLTATSLYLSATAGVLAADLPRPAPVYKAPAAAPVYTWTGWYAGASAGYGWSNGNVNLGGTPVASNGTAGALATLAASIAALPPVLKTDAKGFVAGGQLGYNFQTDRVVWGFETDLSWADIKGSTAQTGTAVLPPFAPLAVSDTATADGRLDWFGTVRGRLGYLIMDPLLVYATGGFAYGHAKSTTTVVAAFAPPQIPFFQTAFGSAAATLTGWTVGGGLEYAFAPRWTLKGEYLYYDLGSLNYSSTLTSTSLGALFSQATVNSHAEFKGSIARVGLNYRFDWARY